MKDAARMEETRLNPISTLQKKQELLRLKMNHKAEDV